MDYQIKNEKLLRSGLSNKKMKNYCEVCSQGSLYLNYKAIRCQILWVRDNKTNKEMKDAS